METFAFDPAAKQSFLSVDVGLLVIPKLTVESGERQKQLDRKRAYLYLPEHGVLLSL